MKEEILSRLTNVVFYESTDSTNVQAKRLAEEGAENKLVVVAETQTAGRGRKGRDWSSPPGKNLYFSLMLRPDFAPDKASMLTIVMAVAVKRAINDVACVQIKWPNDIVADGKKLAGILTEMHMDAGAIKDVVIGVGINVKNQDFPEDISRTATSLEAVFGKQIARADLLEKILYHFDEAYKCFLLTYDLSGLLAEYNACLANKNREVRVLDPAGEFGGVAKGINEKGELLVQTKEGNMVAVYAGEVSVRGIYGYV